MPPNRSLALALGLLFVTTEAHADAAGDAALANVDTAMNRAKTQLFDYEVVNTEPGKAEAKHGIRVWSKGQKVLVEWSAPADMKGTKLLVLSPTETYVFLPSFGKVRRVTGREPNLFGMALGAADFAPQSFGGSYTATIAGDSQTQSKLVLTPKAGQTTQWGKIEMTVAKDRSLPVELRASNATGALARTETRSNVTCEGNVCSPVEIKVAEASGRTSRLVRKSWKVNTDISDDTFSKRALGE